ncbi:MAG TPA: hypothetical protein VJL28_02280 [Gemmatimonadaceae bacterium]|nr:hypothetical protein [Gemmatimonadaceae bacterium]
MAMKTARRARALLLVLATAVACDAKDEAPKVSLAQARADSAHRAAGVDPAGVVPAGLSADAQAALDSGNALFRTKAYARALAQYRLASARAPSHAAPLFGVYMVARATGNQALADSALAGIRERGGAPPAGPIHPSDSALDKGRTSVRKGLTS